MALVGGQPFLLRRALDVLARGSMDLPTLLASADREDGPFGDHLKRILMSVSQLPEVMAAIRASSHQPDLRDTPGYSRLSPPGSSGSGTMVRRCFGTNSIGDTCARTWEPDPPPMNTSDIKFSP